MKTKTRPKRRLRAWALASAVMVAGAALGITGTGTAHADGPATGAVKQLDHVLVECSDVATAHTVFNQLNQGFGLPQVWPFESFGPFSSGGVYLGSGSSLGINLEIGSFDSSYFAPDSPPLQAPPAGTCRFLGMAFEPGGSQAGGSLTQAQNALQSAGIGYDAAPQNEPGGDGNQYLAWTNLYPTGLSSPAISPNTVWMQITCYNNPWLQSFHIPGVSDIESEKVFNNGILTSENGGPLTVTNAEDVTLGSTNKDADIAGLNQLLAPVAAGNSKYEFASGPTLTVRQNSTQPEGITSLTIHVANLSTARSYLQSHGMLGEDDGDHLYIAPGAVGGLTIQLTQS